MPDAVIHPKQQELIAFGLGKLPKAAAAAVASHLEACAACRKTLENLPPDSFVGKVRAAKPGDSSSAARAVSGRGRRFGQRAEQRGGEPCRLPLTCRRSWRITRNTASCASWAAAAWASFTRPNRP